MIKEVSSLRQIPGEPHRHWFSDKYFDLIVWHDRDNGISGFQLCYDPKDLPHAFTWLQDEGFFHDAIDDGDDPSLKYKASPILVPDGVFAASNLLAQFQEASPSLPATIRSLVTDKITQFSMKPHVR